MLISLGHSCQTRFILDAMDGAGRRMPFDFNITTRPALLRALETDGASLQHDEAAATVFAMASDGREGIEVGGFHIWHDYPLGEDKLRLADGWQRDTARVSEKYAALWKRLSEALRSDERKTLMLSNSQHNLGQFCATDRDFASSFGLGRRAFEEIAAALDAYGARNYRLLFLTRSIADLAETQDLGDPRLDHRFVGTLSLRPDRRVAASLAASAPAVSLTAVDGTYENGLWQLRAISPNVMLIRHRQADGPVPHGSITHTDAGAVAWIEGRDRFQDVVLEPHRIRFADGTIWRRD